MAASITPFWKFIDHLGQKRIDIDTDVIKLALATSAYTPDLDAHDFFNDITNEITGTGYTAGGATLASKTWAQNTSLDLWTFDAADVAWTTATFTARYGILYDSTPGSAATNPLIALVDFGADQSPSAGTFTVAWNASGIFTIGKP